MQKKVSEIALLLQCAIKRERKIATLVLLLKLNNAPYRVAERIPGPHNIADKSSLPEVIFKKDVLKNFTKFTGKYLCRSLIFQLLQTFIKKETPTQMSFFEFCKICKKNFILWLYFSIFVTLFLPCNIVSVTTDSSRLWVKHFCFPFFVF